MKLVAGGGRKSGSCSFCGLRLHGDFLSGGRYLQHTHVTKCQHPPGWTTFPPLTSRCFGVKYAREQPVSSNMGGFQYVFL